MSECIYFRPDTNCTWTPTCCVDSDGFAENDMHPQEIEGDFCQFCGGEIKFEEYRR